MGLFRNSSPSALVLGGLIAGDVSVARRDDGPVATAAQETFQRRLSNGPATRENRQGFSSLRTAEWGTGTEIAETTLPAPDRQLHWALAHHLGGTVRKSLSNSLANAYVQATNGERKHLPVFMLKAVESAEL